MPRKKGYKGVGGEVKSRAKKRAAKGSIAVLNKNQRKQLEKLGYIKKRKKKARKP